MYYSVERVVYPKETVQEGTARIIVCCPDVHRPMEKLVRGGDTIIIAPEGSLKLATKNSIRPIGLDKEPLSKRLVHIMHTSFLYYFTQCN